MRRLVGGRETGIETWGTRYFGSWKESGRDLDLFYLSDGLGLWTGGEGEPVGGDGRERVSRILGMQSPRNILGQLRDGGGGAVTRGAGCWRQEDKS